MSGYTSGNSAPTLMAQAPNRKGNISKHVVGAGGVTAVTRPKGNTSYSSPTQGKPSVGGSTTDGRGQKVTVSMPKPYEVCSTNTGYIKNSSYTK